MAEETDVENGRNSNFEGLVTLTFDPAIPHTVVHHSSTSTYIPNFIQIEETFCGWTDIRTYGRTDGRTDIFPLYIIRSTLGSRPKNASGSGLDKDISIKFYGIMHWTLAYTTACTTVQAMITACTVVQAVLTV